MNILLGITGSVAAILAPKLYARLSRIGSVKIMATKSAEHFIKDTVPYHKEEDEWLWQKRGDAVLHIDLRSWADVLVLAPLTANTLSKISHGNADSLVTNVVRAWDYNKPIVLAPTMNTFMWTNPMTKKQIEVMKDLGAVIAEPISKNLMCGEEGKGAMANIESIASIVELFK